MFVVFCFLLLSIDLEYFNGTNRLHFNAIVSDQDLVEVTFDVLYGGI